MRSFVVAIGLGASLLLFSGQADAQYRYTDDKGVSKVTQYKLDVPADYRDAAVWVGPTGVGKPGLSKEAEQTKLRDDAYRRIGIADAGLVKYGVNPNAKHAKQQEDNTTHAPLAEMCISRVQKTMISPGVWKDGQQCSDTGTRFSTR